MSDVGVEEGCFLARRWTWNVLQDLAAVVLVVVVLAWRSHSGAAEWCDLGRPPRRLLILGGSIVRRDPVGAGDHTVPAGLQHHLCGSS